MNTEIHTPHAAANPFSLMLDPAQVLRSMAQSPSLRQLRHQKFSPLDKPMIPLRTAEEARQAAERAAAARAARGAEPSRLSLKALQRQVQGPLN